MFYKYVHDDININGVQFYTDQNKNYPPIFNWRRQTIWNSVTISGTLISVSKCFIVQIYYITNKSLQICALTWFVLHINSKTIKTFEKLKHNPPFNCFYPHYTTANPINWNFNWLFFLPWMEFLGFHCFQVNTPDFIPPQYYSIYRYDKSKHIEYSSKSYSIDIKYHSVYLLLV